MCGICGFISRSAPASIEILTAMTDEIRRRGPDDDGHLVDGRFAIGMRRLSIIDLAGGHQPIFNEDRTVAVVCNGEIYNFKSVRRSLQASGHTFRTASDCEVLVHLYEQHGDDFVQKLDGMFAFALYDAGKGRIVLGRDRLGIKPLFIAEHRDAIVFGSEMKAILKHPSVSRQIDLQALDEYLTYTHVPCPRTIFSSIRKVPAGHTVAIDRELEISSRRYWSLDASIDPSLSEAEWLARCEEKLRTAVVDRLVSDVPLGAFLSGGIDSSLIVAMTAAAKDEPIDTFTVAFKGSGSSFLDERVYAREMDKRYNLRQHELEISPDFEHIEEDLVHAFDEPFADDSLVPTYYVCQAARRDVTVALSGLGGDELFGGYPRHLGLLVGEYYRHVPDRLHRHLIAPAVGRLRESEQSSHFIDRLKRFVRAGRLAPAARYQDSLSSIRSDERRALYSPAVARAVDADRTAGVIVDLESWRQGLPVLESALRTDLTRYLADDVLALTDRVSMWHSLEVRVPFLDHHLVEAVAAMPSYLKIRRRTQKYALRKIAEKWIPESILSHKKQGFESPMGKWLAGPLEKKMRHYLGRRRLEQQGLFDPDAVERLMDQHVTRTRQNGKILFSLLMFQLWMSSSKRADL